MHAWAVMHRWTLHENVDSVKMKVPIYTCCIDTSYRQTFDQCIISIYIDGSLHPYPLLLQKPRRKSSSNLILQYPTKILNICFNVHSLWLLLQLKQIRSGSVWKQTSAMNVHMLNIINKRLFCTPPVYDRNFFFKKFIHSQNWTILLLENFSTSEST